MLNFKYIIIIISISLLILFVLIIKQDEINDINDNSNEFDVRIGHVNTFYLNNSHINLSIGPVADINNDYVEGAKVTLFVKNKSFYNYTNEFGIAILKINITIPRGDYLCIIEKVGFPTYKINISLEIKKYVQN